LQFLSESLEGHQIAEAFLRGSLQIGSEERSVNVLLVAVDHPIRLE
jgi:hypothetical protein